jgi:hypothetical protein
MPSAAAIGKPAQRTSDARDAQEDPGQRGLPSFACIRDDPDLEKSEGTGEAQHYGDERGKTAFAERSEQAARCAWLDMPTAQGG